MGAGSGRTGKAGGKGGGATGGAGPVDLTKMSDGELSAFVSSAIEAPLSPEFHDDITQRMILAMDLNGKPEVVSAAKVEALAKQEGAISLYRTVNNNDTTGQSAKQVADSFRSSEQFSTGGWAGQEYGGGAYFAEDLFDSAFYGQGPAYTTGAVLNKKARVISMEDLRGEKGLNWIKSHPKTAGEIHVGVLGKNSLMPRTNSLVSSTYNSKGDGIAVGNNAYTAMALAMGYNVVTAKANFANEKYYAVLDRSVLTTSTKNYYPYE